MAITFDTGALIKLVDARRQELRRIYTTAIKQGTSIRVPSVVVAEWWREGRGEKERAHWLRLMRIEALDERIARQAGAILGRVRGAGTVDAIVVATAALRGDYVVYTSDPEDLIALRDADPASADLEIVAV